MNEILSSLEADGVHMDILQVRSLTLQLTKAYTCLRAQEWCAVWQN